MPILIELPCKPLVKQYIENRYGSPVVFPGNDWLKNMVVKSLTHPNTNYDSQTSLQYHTQKVELPVEFRIYAKKRNTLTRTDIMLINQTVQDLIEEALYNYLHLYHTMANVLLKDAILKFREQYGFPEESYSTEAITKFFQRERKRRAHHRTENIFSQNVLSVKFIYKNKSDIVETGNRRGFQQVK